MTNREWLATLSDEDFAAWLLQDEVIDFTHTIDNHIYETKQPSPRMRTIALLSTDSSKAIEEWLKKERKE